jgi:hypothetical protein
VVRFIVAGVILLLLISFPIITIITFCETLFICELVSIRKALAIAVLLIICSREGAAR